MAAGGTGLKRTVLANLLRWGFSLAGFFVALVGLYIGFLETIEYLRADPLAISDGLSVAEPLIVGGGIALGVLLWLVGAAIGRWITTPSNPSASGHEAIDTERMKSEILEVMDERLSSMHEELRITRQHVEELKRIQHAQVFEEPSFETGQDRGQTMSTPEESSEPEMAERSTVDHAPVEHQQGDTTPADKEADPMDTEPELSEETGFDPD